MNTFPNVALPVFDKLNSIKRTRFKCCTGHSVFNKRNSSKRTDGHGFLLHLPVFNNHNSSRRTRFYAALESSIKEIASDSIDWEQTVWKQLTTNEYVVRASG